MVGDLDRAHFPKFEKGVVVDLLQSILVDAQEPDKGSHVLATAECNFPGHKDVGIGKRGYSRFGLRSSGIRNGRSFMTSWRASLGVPSAVKKPSFPPRRHSLSSSTQRMA